MMGTTSVQFSITRLNEAAEIDEKAILALYPKVLADSGLQLPEPGKVLFSGIIFKEGHVNTTLESRLFKLLIEQDWTPILTYSKPDVPDEVIATFHLGSFTFAPTKQARKDSPMSWRLDATGASIGKGKNDKLVISFKNPQECHLWQAAFHLCKNAKPHAEHLKRKQVELENQAKAAEQERLDRERTAAIELAIAQSIQKQAEEDAAKAAAELEAARLAMEKEQREEEEARARMEKEMAEAEEAKRVLEKEAAEAEAARLAMIKEEQEAEQARLSLEKELLEAEEAKAKSSKEQAEFIAAEEDYARKVQVAEVALKHFEALRSQLEAIREKGDSAEISKLQAQVSEADAAHKKAQEEVKIALEKLNKERQEAVEAEAAFQKELAEANQAASVYAKEEAEAQSARNAYQKEEAERIAAQTNYEKEQAEADAARADHQREAAEAEAARLALHQKQNEANAAKALKDQKSGGALAAAEALDKVKKSQPGSPKVDPAKANEAKEFVTQGGPLMKYMRAKLVDGKVHSPRTKTVKMDGNQAMWDKRAFAVSNAKLGPSMLLSANNPGDVDMSCNFHLLLSGVQGGEDQLDFQASSKELAEKWVLGVQACINKLPQ
jgi:hypothetical protein